LESNSIGKYGKMYTVHELEASYFIHQGNSND